MDTPLLGYFDDNMGCNRGYYILPVWIEHAPLDIEWEWADFVRVQAARLQNKAQELKMCFICALMPCVCVCVKTDMLGCWDAFTWPTSKLSNMAGFPGFGKRSPIQSLLLDKSPLSVWPSKPPQTEKEKTQTHMAPFLQA